jgi:hypothetical protein
MLIFMTNFPCSCSSCSSCNQLYLSLWRTIFSYHPTAVADSINVQEKGYVVDRRQTRINGNYKADGIPIEIKYRARRNTARPVPVHDWAVNIKYHISTSAQNNNKKTRPSRLTYCSARFIFRCSKIQGRCTARAAVHTGFVLGFQGRFCAAIVRARTHTLTHTYPQPRPYHDAELEAHHAFVRVVALIFG